MIRPGSRETNSPREADEVLADLMECIDRGQRIDRKALRAAFPELADELCAYLDTAERVERMAGPTLQSLDQSVDLDTLTITPEASGNAVTAKVTVAVGDWAAPQPGAVFGDYELLEEIARGGMGVVFKARQKTLNRIVAVKMILTGRLATQDDVARFYKEAEAAAGLEHENIVSIHEVGHVDGHHFFSMEYIDGSDLGRLVRQHPLPAEQAARYLRDVAGAIQFAHEHGILHRDLKPSNVMIDAQGRPQITDFGLAKRVRGGDGLTDTGQVVGTPSYMPPEQAWPGCGEVGAYSDVYSLGAILYELLTGRPPFRAATVMDTLVQVLDTDPAAPRLLNNKVPRDLETICLKCLAKDPERRYATARELAEELDRFLGGQPIKARPINVAARLARWCKRNPVAAGLLAASAILLIFVGALAISTANTMQRQLHDTMREGLVYNARHVANSVRERLNEMAEPVIDASREEDLVGTFTSKEKSLASVMGTNPRFTSRHERSAETTWIVMDTAGRGLYRVPEPKGALAFRGEDWSWRDYYKGCVHNEAWNASGPTYISRPYKSLLGDLYKFAIMAPIYDDPNARVEKRKLNGVIARTFATDANLGLPTLNDEHRKAVLVALEDPDPASARPAVHRLIVHPEYVRGVSGRFAFPIDGGRLHDYLSAYEKPSGPSARSELSTPIVDDEYHDPLLPGRWMAAMAPVPGTPFWVIVQEQYDNAIGLGSLAGRVTVWFGVALGLCVFIMSTAITHAVRRGAWRRA